MQATAVTDQKKSGFEKLLFEKSALFVGFWFLLNLLQISFTELTSDEGYYWVYSTKLQWGYYDHPPMVALLIYLGKAVLPGELGVRLFHCVLLTAAVKLFLDLLPHQIKNSTKTFLLLLSAPLLNYLTFIVFPDGPLLFFSVLFLVRYKKFLEKETLVNAILVGVAMALMLYSKYHGVLIIAFAVLANLRLLQKKMFWLAVAVAAIMFFPHLWWQYQNDFPTFGYHLAGRTGSLSLRYVPEFLSQQIFAISPALCIVLFFVRIKNLFEKTLLYIIIGTLIFFLFSSLKTFIHFHWTSIAVFPLLYFAAHFYHEEKRRKLLLWLVIPFVIILIGARIILLVNTGITHSGVDYYHHRDIWAQQVKQMAGGRPVFFPNNLREASLYGFYSGEKGVALYNRPEKKSQYEMWGYEDSLQGKDVLMVTKYPLPGGKELMTKMKQKIYCSFLSNFASYYNQLPVHAVVQSQTSDSLFVNLTIQNNRAYPVTFQATPPVFLVFHVQQKKEILKTEVVKTMTEADDLQPGASKNFHVAVPIRGLEKSIEIFFGFRHSVIPDSFNAGAVEIR